MQTEGLKPVEFDSPPVLEVSCGIAFTLPKPLKTAHIGLFWSKVSRDFPRCEDAPPIAMIVEGPGSPDSTEINFTFEHVGLPPMRRSWLLNAEGTHLLQLQDDRFLFNWKRTDPADAYPSYKQVVAGFRAQWAGYKAFLAEQGLGEPVPTQLEMTYFNMLSDAQDLFRDHIRDVSSDRFLPKPDAVNWKTLFTLPNSCGRLHVSAASARHVSTGEKGIRLDLMARGLPPDTSTVGCDAWFDLAHDWITQGFADLTTNEAHKNWGRTA